ncbi:MAG: aminotransferase class I/II-fold pyridoxal phosphate-dependent enzyme, partial [Acidimicrobiia bacterium]|nr:aminotransferase class I/II-fold pyridoxal phosphate-dependent enzyme [Acidimicrobiia bacterium]
IPGAFDHGDRVAVAEPGYPCYRNMLEAFGVNVVGIPVGPATRYSLTPDLIRGIGPIDGLVVGNPANPTGTAYARNDLEELAGHCRANGIRLLSDEIYQGIDYDRAPTTVAALDDRAIVLQSFSKYYSMTGWRLGWLVAPTELVAPIERLCQNLFISPPTLSQLAGLAAFDCTEELDVNVERYAVNRGMVLETLQAAGFADVAPADGAFYAYANVEHLTDDSQALCATWLEELGVAVTPGVDFDPARGRRYVRFSYSESTADVAEAMQRIRDWCAGRRGPVGALDEA